MWTAYIMNLTCTRTLWQETGFRSEHAAIKALQEKYVELGFDPEDPACNSDVYEEIE